MEAIRTRQLLLGGDLNRWADRQREDPRQASRDSRQDVAVFAAIEAQLNFVFDHATYPTQREVADLSSCKR